jgi:predicted regulator of Ras-like GTPase activity (Roadblock/LC7/MglB family)
LEYEKALIVGIPIEDAVLAIIADDASSIGMIRLRLQSPITKLKAFF